MTQWLKTWPVELHSLNSTVDELWSWSRYSTFATSVWADDSTYLIRLRGLNKLIFEEHLKQSLAHGKRYAYKTKQKILN